ncbi:MAG: hypothetical protein ASUL_07024 [Candidatus Aramenus sulfurataquae]|jgi:hypothetical protein|uniref:Uncharacterized protein n=2 Tax=Candidatus Aramenus sulfurataquae TaxID=1326980 RepID=W7KUI0_9CREN|nr:MAG: hypothetical protein ASUL_07024 [Candidatus Aramenus sulfurataquae]MCL7343602.1 hypothetical protein [Candidatus Aramenus sulfurataquae]
MERAYLTERPSTKIKGVEIDVPCGTECIMNGKFRELLNNEAFKSQLEVVDSLTDLINVQVATLRSKLEDIFSEFNANVDNLLYAIYRLVEYGGDVVIGSEIKFEERTLVSGDFNQLMRAYRKIEYSRRDSDIVSLCDEIRYLGEALWEHFNKNIAKSLTV